MAYTTPTREPTQARAGDTWRWQRSLPDYPAGAWVLVYTLFSADDVISLTAEAAGLEHLIDVGPSTTAAYTPGRFDWVAHVTDGTDRHQVGAGVLAILPDLSAASAHDGRSHARRMLDAINALLEGRASSGDLDVVRVAYRDDHVEHDLTRLLQLRAQYAAAVAAEDAAAAVARGDNPGRHVRVRFVR